MVLTQGEKMVWAAAFAQTYADLRMVDERQAAAAGVRSGRAAVDSLRSLEKEVRDIAGDDAPMLRAMLGDDG